VPLTEFVPSLGRPIGAGLPWRRVPWRPRGTADGPAGHVEDGDDVVRASPSSQSTSWRTSFPPPDRDWAAEVATRWVLERQGLASLFLAAVDTHRQIMERACA
jgi:hypothetical protein